MLALKQSICLANEFKSRPILREKLNLSGRSTPGRAIWNLEGRAARQRDTVKPEAWLIYHPAGINTAGVLPLPRLLLLKSKKSICGDEMYK